MKNAVARIECIDKFCTIAVIKRVMLTYVAEKQSIVTILSSAFLNCSFASIILFSHNYLNNVGSLATIWTFVKLRAICCSAIVTIY
jgi:hypothetical protein